MSSATAVVNDWHTINSHASTKPDRSTSFQYNYH